MARHRSAGFRRGACFAQKHDRTPGVAHALARRSEEVARATSALPLHPLPPFAENELIDWNLTRLEFAARAVAEVLDVLKAENFERPALGPEGRFPKSGGWRAWEILEGGRA
eukprot:3075990-Pyramimonas_sp.AAC.1